MAPVNDSIFRTRAAKCLINTCPCRYTAPRQDDTNMCCCGHSVSCYLDPATQEDDQRTARITTLLINPSLSPIPESTAQNGLVRNPGGLFQRGNINVAPLSAVNRLYSTPALPLMSTRTNRLQPQGNELPIPPTSTLLNTLRPQAPSRRGRGGRPQSTPRNLPALRPNVWKAAVNEVNIYLQYLCDPNVNNLRVINFQTNYFKRLVSAVHPHHVHSFQITH